jgi:hypothetical protein
MSLKPGGFNDTRGVMVGSGVVPLRGEVRSLQPNGSTLSGQNVDIRCKSLLRRRLARRGKGLVLSPMLRRIGTDAVKDSEVICQRPWGLYTTSLLRKRGRERSFKSRYMWLRAARCPRVRDHCDVVRVGPLKPVGEGV